MSAGVPPKTLLPITAPSYTASPRIAPGPKTFFSNAPLDATLLISINSCAAFLFPFCADSFCSFNPSWMQSILFAKPIRPPSALRLTAHSGVHRHVFLQYLS